MVPQQKHILLIDDSETIHHSLQAILPEFDITFKTDVDTGLEFVQNNPQRVDLIMLDLMMPGKSGLSFLRQFIPMELGIPVILITAANDPEAVREAFVLGAADFINKPFVAQTVRNRVHEVLKKSFGKRGE
jgi:two-component system phosphate regulon response regulator OmpR